MFIPSQPCICTLKVGLVTSMPGQEAVQGVIGPMARCVDDLALAMRAVINERAWLADATLVPVPFKMSVYQGESRAQTQFPGKNGKPRIGYYVHDGFMPASPACARAVMDTVKALREGGYEVVEFAPPRVADGMALFYTLLAGDHGDGMIKMLEGEERESYVDGIVGKMRTIPDFVKDILAFVIDKYMGDKNAAALVTALKTLSVGKLWQAQAKRQQYCKEFHQSMLDAKVDVLVTPPHVLPAIEHGAYDDLSFTACYTILYNLLDLPAGVLPVSRVTADDTYAVNDNENVSFLEKKVRSAYDPVAMQGLPLGVQIIGRSFCDESVLSVMKDVEELLPFTDKPSFLEPGRSI